MPQAFADVFKINENEVHRWMNSQATYPDRLKRLYAYMICTNYLEYSRFRVCNQCKVAFLSKEPEETCDCCKQRAHEAYVMQNESKKNAIHIQIKLNCDAE